jgi:molybdenum cofactor cytidylyltransferase
VLTVAVVLAAGGGTRYVGPTHKLLAELAGRAVIDHAIDHALEAAIGPVLVVTGAVRPPLPETVIEIHNPAWAEGQATSIAAAIEVADQMGADYIVFALGDQPFIDPDAWRTVATAPTGWPITVASYDGRRGPHPVRLHRSVWPMVPTTGDDGARLLIRDHPDLVHDVNCTGSAADIDTLEDVQRWKSS